jgi:hypothetical protein
MANGKASVQIAAHDLGAGTYTVIGQMFLCMSEFRRRRIPT